MIEKFLLKADVSNIITNFDFTYFSDNFSGSTVLITGGGGFLGRYFSSTFLEMNKLLEMNSLPPCKVIVIDNYLTSKKNDIEDSNFQFIQHDVCNALDSFGKIDHILHAAGIASPFYYRKYPLQTLEVATVGLKNILNLAKKNPGCKLSFFSSSEIYGDPDSKYVPTKESYRGNVSCLGPRACYDESKRLGETLVRIYHEQYGVHGTIIRPFNVYGPGMQKTDYRVLPNFASRIFENEPVQIYGTGNQTRTFCYITDAVTGFLKTLTDGVPGEPYNIGNPSPEISMIQLAKSIEKTLNRKILYDVIEYPDSYPADEPNRRCPDITKAFTHFDYSPQISLEEGLKRFLSWASEVYIHD